MVAEMVVTGTGRFAGHRSNISDYTVVEDATPIDPSDSSGGVGQISFTAIEDPNSNGTILLNGNTVVLTDTYRGRTGGIVNAVDVSDGTKTKQGIAKISADSRDALLRVPAIAQPYNGTLGGAFQYYLSLANITSAFVVDSSITARAVAFPGWVGEVYIKMKEMFAAEEVEMNLVSGNLVLRPLRTRVARDFHDQNENWSISTPNLAQYVDVYWYNNTYKINALAYPIDGNYKALPTITAIGAGEQRTIPYVMDPNGEGSGASLSSVVQPVCQDAVDPAYAGPLSVYSVTGNNGTAIPASWWDANGGRVVVSIGEDTRSLYITVTGALDPSGSYAPYTITAKEGADDYSTLRIAGTGVFFNKKLEHIATGVEATRTANLVGTTVDVSAVSTLSDAYAAGYKTARKYSQSSQTVRIDSTSINRSDDNGQVVYPTVSYVDTQRAGMTVAMVQAAFGAGTVDDEQAYWYAIVADNFENQTFGNVGGARVRFRDSFYRIRSASISTSKISYSAEYDTIVSDVQDARSGMTIAAVTAKYSGLTISDEAVIPLWV